MMTLIFKTVLEYAMVCWLGRENIILSIYNNAAAALFSVNY